MYFKLIALLFSSFTGHSELQIKPDAALKLRFGAEAVFTKKNIALSNEQLKIIQKNTRLPIEEKIFTFYKIADSNGKSLGYASLISDTIRSHNQTIMFFINNKGLLQGAELIAYYEPPEYKISSKWMNKHLPGKSANSRLEAGDDLPIVTGSTLTTESLARSSRLALALWQMTFAKSAASK